MARLKRLTRFTRVDGVDVYLHWTTLVIGALLLAASLPRLDVALVAIGAFLGVMFVHEWGHVMVARRQRCVAFSIELYPIAGFTRISAPSSRWDESLIAWGGVLAQLVVAVPLIAWVTLFGYTASQRTNAALALLGYWSAVVAVFNLLPIPPLDGSRAWPLLPMLLRRALRTAARRRAAAQPRPRKGPWVH